MDQIRAQKPKNQLFSAKVRIKIIPLFHQSQRFSRRGGCGRLSAVKPPVPNTKASGRQDDQAKSPCFCREIGLLAANRDTLAGGRQAGKTREIRLFL
jgi:hypothetical protein